MSTKSKALEQLREQMYEHIASAKGNFKEFSNIEKIMFVQQAFNNVSQYCSTKWNMKNNTPFGFIIGHKCAGAAYPGFNGVVANLAYTLRSATAEGTYKTMLHEMRHIRQFKTKETTTRVERLMGSFLRSKDGSQSRAQWNASPMEMQADNFAYKNLIKVNKTMLKNPETRVQAAQNIRELRIARVKNVYQHVIGVAQVAANPILAPLQRLFGRDKSNEQRVGTSDEQGPRVLNLKELTEVFLKNPNNFSEKIDPTDSSIIRSFIALRGDQAHYPQNYFGVLREENQAANQQALTQFQNGQIPLQNNLSTPQVVLGGTAQADINSSIISDKQGEEIVNEDTTTQSNGNPALKDEIISSIIASRSAEKETGVVPEETQDPSIISSSSSSETLSVETSSTEASMDTGGMTQ